MTTDTMNRRLPAEWEPQDGVLLAWPHAASDWAPVLELVVPAFTEIVRTVVRFERAVIAAPDPDAVFRTLRGAGVDTERVSLFGIPTNDTWARDFGPITVTDDGKPRLLDFGFNGWGLKFPACHDNRITRRLEERGAFAVPVETVGLVLEGGSIESDGAGTLLTTSQCLLESNRNPHLTREDLERRLGESLGATHFLWLDHGYLEGDDTDSHVDTLARLAPGGTILHVVCEDPEDVHATALNAMEAQLVSFRTPEGRPYRLLPLPWPGPVFDEAGHRLPATYANFLVINNAVLVPTYADPADDRALAVVGEAFPGREIVGIDSRALLLQHGSLHCVTMQLPQGVLS